MSQQEGRGSCKTAENARMFKQNHLLHFNKFFLQLFAWESPSDCCQHNGFPCQYNGSKTHNQVLQQWRFLFLFSFLVWWSTNRNEWGSRAVSHPGLRNWMVRWSSCNSKITTGTLSLHLQMNQEFWQKHIFLLLCLFPPQLIVWHTWTLFTYTT